MHPTRRYCLFCCLWVSDVTLAALSYRLNQWLEPRRRKSLSIVSQLAKGGGGSEETTLAQPSKGLTIGFLGCGTIASAIATGLLVASGAAQPSSGSNGSVGNSRTLATHIKGVVITQRSESKSTALQQRFPNHVRVVSTSNQDVVDASDIIFLTVLPQQTSQVLQELAFDSNRHTLVSLVSTSNLESLRKDSELNEENVYKMICLPAVAYNEGVCLLQAPKSIDNEIHSTLSQLLEALGGVVAAGDDREMSAMMVPSGLMGTFYGMLRNNRDWMMQHTGLSNRDATYLVTRVYHGMLQDAARELDLDRLIAEQTPGGLNEQALANAESLGITNIHNTIQDAMFRRIVGETDGSL